MKREPFFDNARLILIFLVVFGHVIQPLTEGSELLMVLYQFIYFFHMPAIILISGFFAKGSSEPAYLLKLLQKFIIPYIIFQTLYTAYYYFTTDSGWNVPLFEPHWSLWFLLSLCSWHLLLIIFKKMTPKMGLTIAVILGIAVGYIDQIGQMYSLSRTFVFFPFFLVGYWLSMDQLFKWKTFRYRLISLAVISVVLIGIILYPNIPSGWLFGSSSYASLDTGMLGGLIRGCVYLISFLLSFSLYVWIPRKQFILTQFGEQTLYVYLLHGIFIQFFREYNMIQINNGFDFIFVIVISLGIVLLLASHPVFISFQPIIELKTTGWKQRNEQLN
ncbi:acyltransferase family protein [Amphibacillus sp. Q70]|uniref:acyltransferase family protein n=1 Tax=Amphibacillus sp. Q70 TaxID=3453416 RepID=UPI003F861F3D